MTIKIKKMSRRIPTLCVICAEIMSIRKNWPQKEYKSEPMIPISILKIFLHTVRVPQKLPLIALQNQWQEN